MASEDTELMRFTISMDLEKAVQDSKRLADEQRKVAGSMTGLAQGAETASRGVDKLGHSTKQMGDELGKTSKAVPPLTGAMDQWFKRSESGEHRLRALQMGLRNVAGGLSGTAVFAMDMVGALGPLGIAIAAVTAGMKIWQQITNENKEAQLALTKALDDTYKAAMRVKEARERAAAGKFESQQQNAAAVSSRLQISTKAAESLIRQAAIGGEITPEQAGKLIVSAAERGVTDQARLKELVGAAGRTAARTGQMGQIDAMLDRMLAQMEKGRTVGEAAAIEERRVRVPPVLSQRGEVAARAMATDQGILLGEARRRIYQEQIDRGEYGWMPGKRAKEEADESADRRIRRVRAEAEAASYAESDRLRRYAEREAEEQKSLAALGGGSPEVGRAMLDMEADLAKLRWMREHPRRSAGFWGYTATSFRHAFSMSAAEYAGFQDFVGTEDEYRRAAEDVAVGARNRMVYEQVYHARQAGAWNPDAFAR